MNAIQLIINDTQVVLDPGTKIRIEYNSPIFAEDGIQGSKTYWFDIPILPVNQKLFGFADVPHAAGKYKLFDNAHVMFLGYRILSGKFALRKVSDKYRGALTTNVFGNENKEKKLTELAWDSPISLGSTTQDVIDYANARILENYPTTKFNFPEVENPDFYGEENEAYNYGSNDFINHYDSNNDTFPENELIDPNAIEEVPTGIFNKYTLVPFLYLQELIKKIFNGYQLSGRFVSEAKFQQLMMYNNHSLDDAKDNYWVKLSEAFYDTPEIHDLAFNVYQIGGGIDYSTDSSGYLEDIIINEIGFYKFKFYFDVTDSNFSSSETYIIEVFDNNFVGVMASQQFTKYSSSFVIDTEMTAYFDESQIGHHVSWRFEIQGRDNHESSITFNVSLCDIVNYSQATLNRYAKEIDLKNHVPKKSINETLRELGNYLNIVYYFDNIRKAIQLFLLQDLSDTGFIDLTEKLESKHRFEFSKERNKVMTISFEDDDFAKEESFRDYSDFNYLGDYTTRTQIPEATSVKNVVYVASQNAVYKTKKDYEYGNIWAHYTDINQSVELQSSGERKEIKLHAGPMLMKGALSKVEGYYNDSVYPLPKIKQQGFSIIYSSGKSDNNYQLRLMNWLGKKTYTYRGASKIYPAATSTEYDLDGNLVSDYSLFLNGSRGVVEYFHRDFEDFMQQTETVTMDANPDFSIAELLKMIRVVSLPQDGNPSEHQRWIMVDNMKLLPEKMDVEISMTGKMTVQIKVIKKANG